MRYKECLFNNVDDNNSNYLNYIQTKLLELSQPNEQGASF